MIRVTRRHLLAVGAAGLALPAQAAGGLLPAVCNTPLTPINGWTNVPEYVWGAPERTSLFEPGPDFYKKVWPGSPRAGERLTLTGRVLTTRCQPVPNARLDFWHTNPKGEYDYAGFAYRGLQWADSEGRYRLETIMPGYYNPRRHIHYLIGFRPEENKSAVLVTNAVGLPHEAEFKAGKGDSDIPVSAFKREDGVLTATYDFVIDVG